MCCLMSSRTSSLALNVLRSHVMRLRLIQYQIRKLRKHQSSFSQNMPRKLKKSQHVGTKWTVKKTYALYEARLHNFPICKKLIVRDESTGRRAEWKKRIKNRDVVVRRERTSVQMTIGWAKCSDSDFISVERQHQHTHTGYIIYIFHPCCQPPRLVMLWKLLISRSSHSLALSSSSSVALFALRFLLMLVSRHIKE